MDLSQRIHNQSPYIPLREETAEKPTTFGQTALKVACFAVAIFTDVLMFLPALGLVLYAAIFKPNLDPATSEIKKDKDPILCIHGNGFNEMQWVIGRQFLKGQEYGSTFSLNLDGLLSNESSNGIEEYTQKVAKKVEQIKRDTGRDNVILIGHSMGGLVAANYEKAHPGNVKKVITISTPWATPPLLDFMAKATACLPSLFIKPKRYQQMRNENGFLDQLKHGIDINKYYAIYSTSDEMVPGNRGSLGLDPSHEQRHTMLGHYTPMVSPSLWHQVQKWVKEND